jgi:hypothetical protein
VPPTTDPESAATAPAGSPRRGGSPTALRRQVVVVTAMGAVVLAAVGGGWAVGSGGGPASPTGGPSAPPAPDRTASSACDVQVALDDVRRQLDAINETQREWEGRFGAEEPPEVRDLVARRQALEVRHVVLESQLRAWRSIPSVQAELAKDQDLVAVLDRALAAGRDDSPERQAQLDALSAQRDYWFQQRDLRQRELDRLVELTRQTVESEPLGSGPTATTDRLRGAVLALACDRATPRPETSGPAPTTQSAAAQGSEASDPEETTGGEGERPTR